MAIERLREPPQSTTLMRGHETLYEVTLSAVPSPEWRAAFLRPPARLITARGTPELGRLGLVGARSRFGPFRSGSMRGCDGSTSGSPNANSVVEE